MRGSLRSRSCIVCNSPEAIRALVNLRIAQGDFLRSIAKDSGISKSSIARHKLVCLTRHMLEEFRRKRLPSFQGRLISFVDGVFCLQFDAENLDAEPRVLAKNELRLGDTVLAIDFKDGFIRNRRVTRVRRIFRDPETAPADLEIPLPTVRTQHVHTWRTVPLNQERCDDCQQQRYRGRTPCTIGFSRPKNSR